MSVVIDNNQEKVVVTNQMNGIITNAILFTAKINNFDLPYEVSIVLVDNEKICELNRRYRNIEKPTDVLSFPIVNMKNGEILSDECDINMDDNELIIGDIIISLEKAVKQANEYGHSFERELAFLTIHGMLHLLGYDHINPEEEEIMFKLQEDILTEMSLQNI